jgi:hypothetical protein
MVKDQDAATATMLFLTHTGSFLLGVLAGLFLSHWGWLWFK